jgi:hypothetical protein
VNNVIESAAVDRIAAALAREACLTGDPTDGHPHEDCLDQPGARLADHLWRIVAPLADGNGKAARIAVRRLDQAMGAGELS